MMTTYRAIPRSRPLPTLQKRKKITDRVTELIQYLSRRFGVLHLLSNFIAISLFAVLLTPFLFAAKASRYIRNLLVEFYSRRSVLITFDVPGLRYSDESVLSVHLIDSNVDVDHLSSRIQTWIEEQPMLKLTRKSVLRGWMHLWSIPEGSFQWTNHLVELVPTWKHRLVTEDTVDDYVSHISRLPLTSAAPPWKVFVIALDVRRNSGDAARTCLVVKCHRRLSDALDTFIRQEETLGSPESHQSSDSYSMILLDAALRFDGVNSINDQSTDTQTEPSLIAKRLAKMDHFLLNKKIESLLYASKVRLETWCWTTLCLINGPRILLEAIWKVCKMAKAGAIDASLNGSDGWRRLALTWTPSLPRHFYDQICSATGATSHQVLLCAFSQSMSDHFKQSGSPPEVLNVHVPLPSGGGYQSQMKCDLGLPCRAEDSRHVMETIQQRMSQVSKRRRMRMRTQVTSHWMQICSQYTPWILLPLWRWLVDGSCASVVMESTHSAPANHPFIQSSFKWDTSSPKTQLAVSLSTSETTVRVGLISSVLPPAHLNLIAQNVERYIYQLAASYGVQQRKLSPHSTPHSTPPPTPTRHTPPPTPNSRRRLLLF